jgi:hypothetical protein
MNTKATVKRPAILLWFVTKIVLITMPLAIAIGLIPMAFGIQPDTFIYFFSAIIAYQITSFYEKLTIEIRDYLQKKYND